MFDEYAQRTLDVLVKRLEAETSAERVVELAKAVDGICFTFKREKAPWE